MTTENEEDFGPVGALPSPEELRAAQAKKREQEGQRVKDPIQEGLDKLRGEQSDKQGLVMNNEHDIPGVWEARVLGKRRLVERLPCGHVDSEGNAYQWVTVREMHGGDEDFITSDEIPVNERSSQIIAQCIESISVDRGGSRKIKDPDLIRAIVSGASIDGRSRFDQGKAFTVPDRTACLLFIRRATLGDHYKPTINCPLCKQINKNLRFDLDRIKIDHVSPERAGNRRGRIRLPRSSENLGQEVLATFNVLTGYEEAETASLSVTKENRSSLQILARVTEIEIGRGRGEKFEAEHRIVIPKNNQSFALKIVQDLPKADRDYIRMVYSSVEGKVDTDMQAQCEHCQGFFVFPLDLGQIFFSTKQDQKAISDQDIQWL